MLENEIENIIYNYYSKDPNSKSEGFEFEIINSLLIEKGKCFVEQKFEKIVKLINISFKTNINSKDLYCKVFIELSPTLKRRDEVFNNAINKSIKFKSIYNSSEIVYKQWLMNFESCYLVNYDNGLLKTNINNCIEILKEFEFWVHRYPQLVGSYIISNINWDLGDIPFDKEISYVPTNLKVKSNLLLQLEKNNILQYSRNDYNIEIKKSNIDIILIKKKKYYKVTPLNIQSWLKKFGINISILTSSFMIEHGMPYTGEMIRLNSILTFTHNGHGVIGILAYELSFIIHKAKNGSYEIDNSIHPLKQSVILALSRLEQYLNPNII